MKIIECEQGSALWYQHRIGIPTASEFHRVVTPTGKLSTQSRKYAFRLIAEKVLNRTLDSLDHIEWIEHGRTTEPEAARMYEFQQEVATAPVGFITTDDGRMGCSPDRVLVGMNAGVEIKCPSPQVLLEYLVDGFGNSYQPQVQGQMLIAEFEWVDRFAFHPEMPPVLVRTYRDEPYIRLLRDSLEAFNDMREEMLEAVRAKGFFAERAAMMTPAEHELGAMAAAAAN